MEDILVPIVFFAIIPLTVWSVTHYRYKSRARLAEMVQAIAVSGQPVDEALIKSFSLPQKRPHADLRTGIVIIAIGLGFLVVSGAIPDADGARIMAAFGSFPILVGLALLIFWFFVGRKAE